jgi:hypothetical protein
MLKLFFTSLFAYLKILAHDLVNFLLRLLVTLPILKFPFYNLTSINIQILPAQPKIRLILACSCTFLYLHSCTVLLVIFTLKLNLIILFLDWLLVLVSRALLLWKWQLSRSVTCDKVVHPALSKFKFLIITCNLKYTQLLGGLSLYVTSML